MRIAKLSILALVLTGCEATYDYQGYDMPDHFPLDGSKLEWEYSSADTTITNELLIEKVGTAAQDDVEVVTLEHWIIGDDDSEDLVWSVKWASDSVRGVLIYGYIDHVNDNTVDFMPPIQVAEGHGIFGG